jgi:hypothetical protein
VIADLNLTKLINGQKSLHTSGMDHGYWVFISLRNLYFDHRQYLRTHHDSIFADFINSQMCVYIQDILCIVIVHYVIKVLISVL